MVCPRLHPARGSGPVSPNVHWWRETGLTLLPARYAGKAAFFEPPAEFIAVLKQLHAPGALPPAGNPRAGRDKRQMSRE